MDIGIMKEVMVVLMIINVTGETNFRMGKFMHMVKSPEMDALLKFICFKT